MKISRFVIQALCLLSLWLGLGLQAHAQTDTVTYVYTDPQGTPLVEADAQGNVIARYDYTPYGNAVASLGSPANGPGYTGHVNDPETGLVYMQARYYVPAVGRFLSIDPSKPTPGNVFNFNRNAYASNNPIGNIDPNGKQSLPLSNELGTTDPKIINDVQRAEYDNAASVMGFVNQVTEPLMFAYPELDAPEMLGAMTEAMGFGSEATAASGVAAGSEVPLATPLSTYRMTGDGETFYHYSQAAHADSLAGGLRPGSFATNTGNLTAAEAQSGLALPHTTLPNAVYTVSPESGTWVNMNPFAEPLNGQPGGLSEWQFPQGTGPGTVSAPRDLDDAIN